MFEISECFENSLNKMLRLSHKIDKVIQKKHKKW